MTHEGVQPSHVCDIEILRPWALPIDQHCVIRLSANRV
jgi:hypothetical protein